jgi:hypothetical protein
LFMLANIIFITQSGRDVHQLIGVRAFHLDQFEPEKIKARSERRSALVNEEYQTSREIGARKGKGSKRGRIFDKNTRTFTRRGRAQSKYRASRRSGVSRRFSLLGAVPRLGSVVFRTRARWSGLSIVIAGFTVLSIGPALHSSAPGEFHALLLQDCAHYSLRLSRCIAYGEQFDFT